MISFFSGEGEEVQGLKVTGPRSHETPLPFMGRQQGLASPSGQQSPYEGPQESFKYKHHSNGEINKNPACIFIRMQPQNTTFRVFFCLFFNRGKSPSGS